MRSLLKGAIPDGGPRFHPTDRRRLPAARLRALREGRPRARVGRDVPLVHRGGRRAGDGAARQGPGQPRGGVRRRVRVAVHACQYQRRRPRQGRNGQIPEWRRPRRTQVIGRQRGGSRFAETNGGAVRPFFRRPRRRGRYDRATTPAAPVTDRHSMRRGVHFPAMRSFLAGSLCLLLGLSSSAWGQIDERKSFVESMGFNRAYRVDAWVPMVVNLTSTVGEPAEYQIQVLQPDIDGDRVIYSRLITLNANMQQKYWVYFRPQPTGLEANSIAELQRILRVRLCTRDGKELAILPLTNLL